MNKNALKALLASNGDTLTALAKLLDCSVSTLSKKVNEKSANGFTQPEILLIKKHYMLNADEIDYIFFNDEVS